MKKKLDKKRVKQMDNHRFVGEENIPLVQDEDCDNYRTPDTIRIDEVSFTVLDNTEATSKLQLRQKVKQDKLTALYRDVNVTGNPELIDLDRLRLTKDLKKRSHNF